MVEISYEPAKKLVIMETTAYTLEEFLETISSIMKSGQPFLLSWAEGIIFVRFPVLPTTRDLVKDLLEGTIYWSTIIYASMPTFQNTIKAGGFEIPVINMTPNMIMKQVAIWLKENKFSSEKQ